MSKSLPFCKALGMKTSPINLIPVEYLKQKTVYLNNFLRKVLSAQNILIALALLCIIVLLRNLIEAGILAAMCLFVGIFLLPVISRELRQDKYILFVFWFVVVLHQCIAFINAYFFRTYGAGADASHFQSLSEEFALFGGAQATNGAQLYVQVLGLVYRWIGSSHLFGEQLSILAFAFSCIILIKLMRLLEIKKYKVYSLLAFGSLPTMVFLGSITLRESYQILFFMLAVFFGIKMHLKGRLNVYIPIFILSVIGMCTLHRGLIGFAMFMIPLFFVWSLRPASHLGSIKKMRLLAFVMCPIAVIGLLIMSEKAGLSAYARFINNDWLDVLSQIRDGPIKWAGRTTYGVALDLSSNVMTIYSFIKIYFYYLFAPFPWQVSSFIDVYASMESFFRMILICFSVKHWINAVGSQKRLFGLLLILYFSITFLFALATSNYGTAMRHHMLSWWIIVVIGIPPLVTKLSFLRFDRRSSV
jgi:hypothetical protein